MALTPNNNVYGVAKLGYANAPDIGHRVKTATLNATWPNSHVEGTTLTFTTADVSSGASPSSNNGKWVAILVEDAVDVGGNYMDASIANLTAGVAAIVDLCDRNIGDVLPATFTFGNNSDPAGHGFSRNGPINKGGTYRVIFAFGVSGTATAALDFSKAVRLLAVDTGATSLDVHSDGDGYHAQGVAAITAATITDKDAGVCGRRLVVTSETSTAGNWRYRQTNQVAVSLRPAGATTAALIGTKQVKLALTATNGAGAGAKLVRASPSSTVGDITFGNILVDTDFGEVIGGSTFFTQLGVNDVFGDATTPAAEKADIYSIGTPVGTTAAQRAAYLFAAGGEPAGQIYVDQNRIRTLTATLTAGAAIQVFANAGRTVAGSLAFSSAGRTVARNVFHRSGPTETTDAIPFLRTWLADAYGAIFASQAAANFAFNVLRHTDNAQENTQVTVTTDAAGKADWSYTVANSHLAFNRNKFTLPDNPASPPANGQFVDPAGVLTAISSNITIGGNSFSVGSIAGLYIGCMLRINAGGLSQEDVKIVAIAPTGRVITETPTFVNAHTAGESVTRLFPAYPKIVQVKGNGFSVGKEPTVSALGVFGVNSEIVFSGLWTGDLANATIDANNAPSGVAGRTKNLGTGALRFKACSLINEATGRLDIAGAFNPNDITAGPYVLTTDHIFGRYGSFNVSTSTLKQSPANDGSDAQYALVSPLGYNSGSGGDNGFQQEAAPSDPGVLALYYAYSDIGTTRNSFTINAGSPETAGFSTDSGNYGLFRQQVQFISVDPNLLIQATVDDLTPPPNQTLRFTFQLNRILPDGSLSPTPTDVNGFRIYASQDQGLGQPLNDFITNAPTTEVSGGTNTGWQYIFTPPANGSYAVSASCLTATGSRPTAPARIVVEVGLADDNLVVQIGDTVTLPTEAGNHIRKGVSFTFGLGLLSRASKQFVSLDTTPTVIIIGFVRATGQAVYLDSDLSWKNFDGVNVAYEWPTILDPNPGCPNVYVLSFSATQSTTIWSDATVGLTDFVYMGKCVKGGVTYNGQNQVRPSGGKQQHRTWKFDPVGDRM